MCAQEVIWCNCGHGEFLPIVKCRLAQQRGQCYVVIHGDHDLIAPGPCSACLTGLTQMLKLTPGRPSGDAAQVVTQRHTEACSAPSTAPPTLAKTKGQESAGDSQLSGEGTVDQSQQDDDGLPDLMELDFENLLADNDGWTFV